MTFSTIETYHQLLANFLKEYDPDEGSRADSVRSQFLLFLLVVHAVFFTVSHEFLQFLDPAISKDTYYWLNSRKSFWRRKRFSLTEFRSTDGSSHTKRRRLDKTVTDSDDLDDPEDGQRISYVRYNLFDSFIFQSKYLLHAILCLALVPRSDNPSNGCMDNIKKIILEGEMGTK
jgi:hypothetical protein